MGREMSQAERREEIRRAIDVDNLITRKEFDAILEMVEENTKLTKDIHDLLHGLKVMAHIAKWVTIMSAGVAATAFAIKQMLGIKF